MAAKTSGLYSVSELTYYVKQLLESDSLLKGVQVSGEVSNLTYHRSGHVYFSLKDQNAQLSCVMFRMFAQSAPKMAAGDKVVVKGNMSVYAPRGNYQLMVQAVRKQGLGDLYQQFLMLKEKLRQEGLFNPERKQALPAFPERIAVLTSPTGAAIKDILQTLQRRWGIGEVIVIPTVVQGVQGAPSIIRGLKQLETIEADVAILARGGGSLEDLWNFNEEAVARAVANCSVPLISGVGHETDITIVDYVADVRASTPTAAAEQIVPDRGALVATLNEFERQFQHSLQYFIDFKRQMLDDYSMRLERAVRQSIQEQRHVLTILETKLQGMDSRRLLDQGYTLTLKNGKILSSSEGVKEGDTIETIFSDGRVSSVVDEKQS
ncbi:MAG: exodeoxyribonuclease VII large subunit [Bacteroidota bacterium]